MIARGAFQQFNQLGTQAVTALGGNVVQNPRKDIIGQTPVVFSGTRPPFADDKPVKVSVEAWPGGSLVHHDRVSCASALAQMTGQSVSGSDKLIVPMIERFMATDRAFAGKAAVARISQLPKRPKDPDSARGAC